jgi:hypothetical protein
VVRTQHTSFQLSWPVTHDYGNNVADPGALLTVLVNALGLQRTANFRTLLSESTVSEDEENMITAPKPDDIIPDEFLSQAPTTETGNADRSWRIC